MNMANRHFHGKFQCPQKVMKEKMDSSPLDNTYLIKDFETLKVIADPVRYQILEVLLQKPQNVKEVAEKLGLAPSKLYYHFNMLEKFQFIEVAETRQVGNLLEKYYRAAANFLSIDPGLLSFSTDEGKENVQSVMTAAIDATREDLVRSLQARSFQLTQGAAEQPRSVTISRNLANLKDEKFDEFHQRLEALIEEFSEADSKDVNDQIFALTVALYPSYYYQNLNG
jgi:DNA-binding transcriptional ArsR family regulator